MTNDPIISVFEERAENLSEEELRKWTATTPGDKGILAKLMGPGAKLLTGPRGSGKSTFLRRAYFNLVKNTSALPIYVNYAKSLALEPLFHNRANALALFRQWVLAKIVVSAQQSFSLLGVDAPRELSKFASHGGQFIRNLEIGVEKNDLPDLPPLLSPTELIALLERASDRLQSRRTVLLLDDAAHAFSPEQQREFFEIFRQLRTRRISPKAAVYPGVTSYSPFFHIGHEAELIEAWYRPDDHGYLPLMHDLVSRRLPSSLSEILLEKPEMLDILAYASFGIPRGFLNMIAQALSVDEGEPRAPTRQSVMQAVADHAEATSGVFRSLQQKLPRFRHFVDVGNELVGESNSAIRDFNVGRDISSKAVIIAIKAPLSPEFERISRLLEYSGVLRETDSISRGVKGVFERFAVHYAFLITSNSLSLGKSYALSDIVDALSRRDPHAFVRRSQESLLGDDYPARCILDLPPCESCGTPRLTEEQLYCMRCGSELPRASLYLELLRSPISNLPLTETKATRILDGTSLRTVQDILADDENQLRSVRSIGPVWQARIKTYAEEYVSV